MAYLLPYFCTDAVKNRLCRSACISVSHKDVSVERSAFQTASSFTDASRPPQSATPRCRSSLQ